MKHFTKESWNQNLAGKNWEDLGTTEDVEEMASMFGNCVEKSLDECAPWKETKVRRKSTYSASLKKQWKQ